MHSTMTRGHVNGDKKDKQKGKITWMKHCYKDYFPHQSSSMNAWGPVSCCKTGKLVLILSCYCYIFMTSTFGLTYSYRAVQQLLVRGFHTEGSMNFIPFSPMAL